MSRILFIIFVFAQGRPRENDQVMVFWLLLLNQEKHFPCLDLSTGPQKKNMREILLWEDDITGIFTTFKTVCSATRRSFPTLNKRTGRQVQYYETISKHLKCVQTIIKYINKKYIVLPWQAKTFGLATLLLLLRGSSILGLAPSRLWNMNPKM